MKDQIVVSLLLDGSEGQSFLFSLGENPRPSTGTEVLQLEIKFLGGNLATKNPDVGDKILEGEERTAEVFFYFGQGYFIHKLQMSILLIVSIFEHLHLF